MVRTASAVALLMLAGCSDIPQARSENDIKRIAAEGAASEFLRLQNRIDKLESQAEAQQREIATIRNLALATSDAHDSLVKTFNGNVRKDNEDAANDMTRRGACGYTPEPGPAGGTIWTPRKCTINDLRK